MPSASQAGPPSSGELLGTVRLPRNVTADGKPLPAGSYQVRLTAQEATPVPPGQTPSLERWIEFVQGGQVKGREVVTVVPDSDIAQVADGPRPRAGASRVEMLKAMGHDYAELEREGVFLVVHSIGCKYHRPARFGDRLRIHTRVERATMARIEHSYRVYAGASLLAEATSTIACVDSDGVIRRMPERIVRE